MTKNNFTISLTFPNNFYSIEANHMKPRIVISVVVLLCNLFAAATSLGLAQETQMTDQARDRFIEEFDRIGLNTTPGDAMMLPPLVSDPILSQ